MRIGISYDLNVNRVFEVSIPLDTIAPAVVQGMSVVAGNTIAQVDWTFNSEPDVAGYYIYVNGVKNNVELVTTKPYTITGLTNSITYNITMSVVDNAGNESGQNTVIPVVPVVPNEYVFGTNPTIFNSFASDSNTHGNKFIANINIAIQGIRVATHVPATFAVTLYSSTYVVLKTVNVTTVTTRIGVDVLFDTPVNMLSGDSFIIGHPATPGYVRLLRSNLTINPDVSLPNSTYASSGVPSNLDNVDYLNYIEPIFI